jgi:hypothetical protein
MMPEQAAGYTIPAGSTQPETLPTTLREPNFEVRVVADADGAKAPVLAPLPKAPGAFRQVQHAPGCRVTRTHPHVLRHTFVTASFDAGADLRDVQIATRHADPRTTIGCEPARTWTATPTTSSLPTGPLAPDRTASPGPCSGRRPALPMSGCRVRWRLGYRTDHAGATGRYPRPSWSKRKACWSVVSSTDWSSDPAR